MTLRCLIVDDSTPFLAVASSILGRQGIDVVGTAPSAATAGSRAAELQPDVVLVDVDLGAESGLDVANELARGGHGSVILMSSHAEADFAQLIGATPAVGFIPKAQLSARAIHELLR